MLALGITLGGAAGVPGAGAVSIPFSTPASPALVGAGVFWEVPVLDPAATFSISMTNAVDFRIG